MTHWSFINMPYTHLSPTTLDNQVTLKLNIIDIFLYFILLYFIKELLWIYRLKTVIFWLVFCSNKIPHNHALLYSKILQIEYTSTASFAVLTAQIIVHQLIIALTKWWVVWTEGVKFWCLVYVRGYFIVFWEGLGLPRWC